MNLHRTTIWNKAALVGTLALLTASGCHKKQAAPPPAAMAPESITPPPTASITADPPAIDLGQSVVLNWRTSNATGVSIDGIGEVAVNGTQTVSPSSSTNFHLVAKNGGGTTEANVRVTVRVPEVPAAPADNNGNMGSDAAFHAAVQDVFFGYDSFDLNAQADTSITAAAACPRLNTWLQCFLGL